MRPWMSISTGWLRSSQVCSSITTYWRTTAFAVASSVLVRRRGCGTVICAIAPQSLIHTELVPEQARIADIGSGAGLPGLVWALARPDCSVTLVEPLQRRTSFLSEVVTELGLDDRVQVLRGACAGPASAWVPTWRPVARWHRWVRSFGGRSRTCNQTGGVLLAMKGSRASRELSEARETIDDVGGHRRWCGSARRTPLGIRWRLSFESARRPALRVAEST